MVKTLAHPRIMRNKSTHVVMTGLHRSLLLVSAVAMLASCAWNEPMKKPGTSDLADPSNSQARNVPAPVRVEQRMVEGRLQFVFCVSDCQAVTPKVMQVQELQSELAMMIEKAKQEATMAQANQARGLAASGAPAVARAPVAAAEAATSSVTTASVITPVETIKLNLDRDLSSWWVVYFKWASAELGPHAKNVLDRSVAVAKQSKRIIVSATADPTGDQEKNRQLVRDRVLAVKSYLVSKGVDASKLELAVMPESSNGLPSLAPTLASIGFAVPNVQGMNLPVDGFAKQRRTELLIQFSK